MICTICPRCHQGNTLLEGDFPRRSCMHILVFNLNTNDLPALFKQEALYLLRNLRKKPLDIAQIALII